MFKIILLALVAFHHVSCSEKIKMNSIEDIELEPLMIIEQSRHCERTPKRNYLHEEWVKSLGGGYQLTKVGINHCFKLGQATAKAYPNIFKNFQVEKRNKFYKLYSTKESRTIESLHSHMLGLLNYYKEKVDDNKVSNLLSDNNIPQFIQTNNHEIFRTGFEPSCPAAADKMSNGNKQFLQRLDIKISKDSQNLIEKIKQHGIDLTKFDDKTNPNSSVSQVKQVADWIKMYNFSFGKLPSQITEKLYDEIKYIENMAFFYKYNPKGSAKFQTTKLSEFVREHFQKAMQNFKTEKQYYGYIGLSAHESNIIPFMISLGLTSYSCWAKKYENSKKGIDKNKSSSENCEIIPAPGANIIWELSRSKNKEKTQFYVRMQYKGTPLDLQCKNKEKLAVGYCEFDSWEEFNSKYFIDKDYDTFCGKHMVKKGYINDVLFISQIVVILILSLFITFFCMRYRKLLKMSELVDQKVTGSNVEDDVLRNVPNRIDSKCIETVHLTPKNKNLDKRL